MAMITDQGTNWLWLKASTFDNYNCCLIGNWHPVEGNSEGEISVEGWRINHFDFAHLLYCRSELKSVIHDYPAAQEHFQSVLLVNGLPSIKQETARVSAEFLILYISWVTIDSVWYYGKSSYEARVLWKCLRTSMTNYIPGMPKICWYVLVLG